MDKSDVDDSKRQRRANVVELIRQNESFQRLLREIRRNNAVLFLGAGASFDAGLPSSSDLARSLRVLASACSVRIGRDAQLGKIASVLEEEGYRADLINQMRLRVMAPADPNSPPWRRGIFRYLPYLENLDQTVFTTNWDDLAERAFEDAGRRAHVVRTPGDLLNADSMQPKIVKLHGDFARSDLLVVSKTDYERVTRVLRDPTELPGTIWAKLSMLFVEKSVVFVGYSLQDRNLQLLRQFVDTNLQGRTQRGYFVAPIDDADQDAYTAGFQVNVIPATASDFGLALATELMHFINRSDDLDTIFKRASSHIVHIHAPFGAGKSAFLDEICGRAPAMGWEHDRIFQVDFADMLCGMPMADFLNSNVPDDEFNSRHRRPLLLLFDHVEHLDQDALSELNVYFEEKVLPTLQTLRHSHIPSLVVLASRSAATTVWRPRVTVRSSFLPLSTFSRESVYTMVRNFTMMEHPDLPDFLPGYRLVDDIYHTAGRGHPGFIKRVLTHVLAESEGESDTASGGFALPPTLPDKLRMDHLEQFTKIIRSQVLQSLEPSQMRLYEAGLCLLRGINHSVMDTVASQKQFCEELEPEEIRRSFVAALRRADMFVLADTYAPLQKLDPTIRIVFSEWLKYCNPELAAAVHATLAEVWSQMLVNSNDPYGVTPPAFFIEWLYHQGSHIAISIDSREEKERLLTQRMQAIISDLPSGDYSGHSLIARIWDRIGIDRPGKPRDDEVIDLLSDCFGDQEYDRFSILFAETEE